MTAFRRLKAPRPEPALADEERGAFGVWEGNRTSSLYSWRIAVPAAIKEDISCRQVRECWHNKSKWHSKITLRIAHYAKLLVFDIAGFDFSNLAKIYNHYYAPYSFWQIVCPDIARFVIGN